MAKLKEYFFRNLLDKDLQVCLNPLKKIVSYMKNILLTNDDGLEFIGLKTLKEELSSKHNVFVFAPASEQSGTSSAIHIYNNIYVKKLSEKEFMVEGYPVDCVNIGLFSNLAEVRFDLLVSGINKGVNMGDDIYYSGTVGAARHACVHNIPAIGISSGYLDKNGNYKKISKFVSDFIDQYFDELDCSSFININYPASDQVKGFKITYPGKRIYRDIYARYKLSSSSWLVNLGGSTLDYHREEGTDFEAFENNFISVSPISMNKSIESDIKRWNLITNREAKNG